MQKVKISQSDFATKSDDWIAGFEAGALAAVGPTYAVLPGSPIGARPFDAQKEIAELSARVTRLEQR